MNDFELGLKLTDRYVPAPRKPDGFDDEVRRITNGNGRIVWGCDVRCDNRPDLLKYGKFSPWGIDRWLFETKINMAVFPRKEWDDSRYQMIEGKQEDVLGPYPNQMWGMKMPLMDFENNGAYLPCDERFLTWLRQNHYAWMNAPSGKFASMAAYRQMITDMDSEQRERNAETEKNADELAEYYNTNRERINAEGTRHGVIMGDRPMLVTADGTPWSSATSH